MSIRRILFVLLFFLMSGSGSILDDYPLGFRFFIRQSFFLYQQFKINFKTTFLFGQRTNQFYCETPHHRRRRRQQQRKHQPLLRRTHHKLPSKKNPKQRLRRILNPL